METATKEVNIRESLTWINIQMSSAGWTNDIDAFAQVDTNLGAAFIWASGPDASGGTLSFRSQLFMLTRAPSTTSSMGSWK